MSSPFSSSSFPRVALALAGLGVAAVPAPAAVETAGPPGTFSTGVGVGVTIVTAIGLVAWLLCRRARLRLETESAARTRQMAELIEHADCVFWEAEVELEPNDWVWRMQLHPSAFCRQLFRGRLPQPRSDLWVDFHIEDREAMDRRARTAVQNGEPGYEQEFRAMRDRRVYWLHENVSITRLAPNRYWLVGLVTDITARREAEAARRQSELTVESILQHAQCMLWRATVIQENGVLKWPHFDIPNSQFSELLFGDRVFSPDRGFWENLATPDQARMDEVSSRAITGSEPGYTQQFRAINRAGRTFWLHENVSITRVGDRHWSLVGVVTDITAQHAAEEARRESETRLSYLLERADCLIWEAKVTLRPDDTLGWDLYTPRSVLLRRLFGEGERTDLRWYDLKVPEFPEMTARALHAVKSRASGYTQEFHAEMPSGAIWLREVVTMVEQPDGRFHLVGVITDITAQRLAEEALRRSEQRLAALLERADCMIWQGECRRSGPGQLDWTVFTPNSQLYRRLFGREPDGVCHFPWDNGSVPECDDMRRRSLHALATGLPGYEQVFHYLRAEGDIWLHEKVSIQPIETDRWGLVGIITDITAQRMSELARAASEARLQDLLARADCLLWEATVALAGSGNWDWNFHIHPSGLCQALYGVPQPRPETGLWRQFNIPELPAMNACCDAALRGGQPGYEQVFHIERMDGSAIWISESVTIRPLGGDRFSLVGVAVDITPQRGAEEALAAEKERLSVTLRAMSECVITTDVDGIVQYMNPAAATLTGWPEAEAIGRPLAEVCRLTDGRTAQAVDVPAARVARGDVVADLPPQSQLVTRAGQPRLVEGCCAPIHAADSKVKGTVLVFRDVTEHERLEQELVRATRLESVGVLAGGIAHDFNNILTAVMGNLALAQLDVGSDAPAAASLRSAEKAALRARDLTQQLLTFAKGGEPVRAAVQLEAIVREMTAFALHGSQVKAFYDHAPDLWPADADKGQIGRVVQNLVINAVQAMPGGGTLRITARNDLVDGLSQPGLAPGSYILIAIADTGQGIRSDHLPHIFDPYFTTKQSGTGLGLAAVYSIIKKHHGRIDVESQVGQGTTFRIWLPALRVEAPRAESRVPVRPGRLAGRVLIMDDEQIIREVATALLSRFGLDVECAEDGEEAIAKYRAALERGQRFDLVITDLTVPGGMGGLAALRHLREMDPAVKAIVSSGYSSDPVLANFRDHGFVAVVAKPYEVEDFARVLREVLPP